MTQTLYSANIVAGCVDISPTLSSGKVDLKFATMKKVLVATGYVDASMNLDGASGNFDVSLQYNPNVNGSYNYVTAHINWRDPSAGNVTQGATVNYSKRVATTTDMVDRKVAVIAIGI